ncbi:MAG: MFS transporter [Gemmatimonadaceae bacterium]
MFPLFAQGILHFTPTETGLVMLPGGLATASSALVCGFLLNGKNPKADPRWLIFIGVILFAISMWRMGHLTTSAGIDDVRTALLVRGFGLGFLFAPINNAAYASIKPQEAQHASGLISLCRQLGGAFGIAVLLNQLSKATQIHRVDLVANVVSGNAMSDQRLQAITQGFLAKGMDAFSAKQAALGVISGQVQTQAAMLGFNDSWIFILIVFVAVSPSILLLRRPKRGGAAPEVDAH